MHQFFGLLTITEIISFFKNKLTLLMMTVMKCCVFNLLWAYACPTYAFSSMLLVTFFIQRLQTFY